MKVWRVWFKNGNSRLVEAENEKDAAKKARAKAKALKYETKVTKVVDSGPVSKIAERDEIDGASKLQPQPFVQRRTVRPI